MTHPTESPQPPDRQRWRPILGAILNFALGLGGLLGTGFLVVKQWKQAMVSLAIGLVVVYAYVLVLVINPGYAGIMLFTGQITLPVLIMLVGTPVYIVIWVFSIVLVLQGLYPDDGPTEDAGDAGAPD